MDLILAKELRNHCSGILLASCANIGTHNFAKFELESSIIICHDVTMNDNNRQSRDVKRFQNGPHLQHPSRPEHSALWRSRDSGALCFLNRVVACMKSCSLGIFAVRKPLGCVLSVSFYYSLYKRSLVECLLQILPFRAIHEHTMMTIINAMQGNSQPLNKHRAWNMHQKCTFKFKLLLVVLVVVVQLADEEIHNKYGIQVKLPATRIGVIDWGDWESLSKFL